MNKLKLGIISILALYGTQGIIEAKQSCTVINNTKQWWMTVKGYDQDNSTCMNKQIGPSESNQVEITWDCWGDVGNVFCSCGDDDLSKITVTLTPTGLTSDQKTVTITNIQKDERYTISLDGKTIIVKNKSGNIITRK